jgi:hypothetical protein
MKKQFQSLCSVAPLTLPALQTHGYPSAHLVAALAVNGALVAAVSIAARAMGAGESLPQQIKDAAPPGAPCVLFWPPPGFTLTQEGATNDSKGQLVPWWIKVTATCMTVAGVEPAQVAKVWRSATRRVHDKPAQPADTGRHLLVLC